MCVQAKLADYKKALLEHPAFAVKSKLENLAEKYGVKVIFIPKYHCELNPIEGLWFQLKYYIRKHSDQTFPKMKSLMTLPREVFIKKRIFIKLIKRFWKCLDAYSKNASYGTVLWTYFSGNSQEKCESHRKYIH